MDFGRVITAMVTPFDPSGRIDWEKTEELIEKLIVEQGSDGLVVCGTTGESPTLTDEEKVELFRFAVSKAKGRCRILAGTGSNHTEHSVHLSHQAAEAGVDALLLVAPYYNRPTQEGLYQHFKRIAETTELPIMLYNIPGRTGINIAAETTVRLSAIPNIVAIKEATDLDQIAEIVERAPADFRVYSGDDKMALPTIAVGGYGVVSVASHLIGRKIRAMIDAYLSGDTAQAASIHRNCLPVFNGLFICPNPVPVKYALQAAGFPVGSVRLPLVEPNEKERAFLDQLVRTHALS